MAKSSLRVIEDITNMCSKYSIIKSKLEENEQIMLGLSFTGPNLINAGEII